VWPRTYSKYALFNPRDILTAYAWDAIDAGGWAMREFHSVTGRDVAEPYVDLPTDEGFGPIPATLFDEHLGFLAHAWKANQIWTCNPSECIKYRHTRQAYTASIAGNVISYAGTVDAKFQTPVSVMVTTSADVGSLVATQAGSPVRTRKVGPSTFSVTANPALGDVSIDAACDDADPNVVDAAALDAGTRPAPATSVCDIVNVVGTGSDGKMDDLTRNTALGENHYSLPNPSQADGRDGAWSGYGMQNYGIEMDGENPYIHAIMADASYSGVTLAMLGGNGAGACYDASAYCGVSFRIRANGSALGAFPPTSSEVGANVLVSFITATTQTAALGGDRTEQMGDTGGHYPYAITATETWATKHVIWDSFTLVNPWWCMATPCSTYPFDKTAFQAIDWSYDNVQTGTGGPRYIDLDDIEMIPVGDMRCSDTDPNP
jgi:hypothetical protein